MDTDENKGTKSLRSVGAVFHEAIASTVNDEILLVCCSRFSVWRITCALSMLKHEQHTKFQGRLFSAILCGSLRSLHLNEFGP